MGFLVYTSGMQHHALPLFIACVVIATSPSVAFASSDAHLTKAVDAFPNYKIAAIMVTSPDKPATPIADDKSGPWTKQYLDKRLFSDPDSMAAYYASESEGALSVSGDVYDNDGAWYTAARPVASGSDCDWWTFVSDAMAAADADIDFRQYNTVMVLSPMYDCGSGGFATTVRNVPDTGGQSYGAIVLNGTLNTYPHHELGHLIGFGHANSWQCDPPGVLTGMNCRLEEYGDRYGIMGASSRMSLLPAPLKERMGWLRSSEIMPVMSDGDYVLYTYEKDVSPKVLKIPQARDGAGNVTSWYYLEYRQPIGYDNVTGYTPTVQQLGIPNGVLIRLGPTGSDLTTTLLDMTPGSRSDALDIFEPTLQVGSSYLDAAAGVSFGIVSRNATSMTVRVKFGGASLCTWKAPTVTAKSLRSSGKPGAELSYAMTVKNNSVLCGKQTMELRTTVKPKGWKVTVSKATKKTFDLVPGASKKYIIRMTSPKTAMSKKYTVKLEARFTARPTLKKSYTLRPTVK